MVFLYIAMGKQWAMVGRERSCYERESFITFWGKIKKIPYELYCQYNILTKVWSTFLEWMGDSAVLHQEILATPVVKLEY
jgi:hypothetical protein